MKNCYLGRIISAIRSFYLVLFYIIMYNRFHVTIMTKFDQILAKFGQNLVKFGQNGHVKSIGHEYIAQA